MIEKHVVNYDLSKRLSELGIKKESIFSWFPSFTAGHGIEITGHEIRLSYERAKVQLPPVYPAYIASEVLEMLPTGIENYTLIVRKITNPRGYQVYYDRHPEDMFLADIEDLDIQNALAKMLIYLIENKIVSVEHING